MAAAPKLTPGEWQQVRAAWESDPREGFAWLLTELSLSVSRESVRKKAVSKGWKKRPESFGTRTNHENGSMVAQASSGNLTTTLDASIAEEARPFKTRETPVLDELDEREPRQGLFAREYCKDLNGTQAAIRSGYSVDSAGQIAHELLKKHEIQAAIRELRAETLRKVEAKVDELITHWLDILRADPNAITSYRRQCCPHCWGQLKEDGYKRHRQYTPARFYEAKTSHEVKKSRTLAADNVDIGDFDGIEGDWYSRHKEPNPKCPECEGEGIGEHFIADTRGLAPGVAALFNGVEKTKDGIKVLMASKEKAADQLGRFLGAFKDKETTVNVNVMAPDALTEMYWTRLKTARERQRKVDVERGNIIDMPIGDEPEAPWGC